MNFPKISKEIRKLILNTIYNSKAGHIGGSLSCVDILISLYFDFLRFNAKEPNMESRDRLISKGHASVACILYYQLGFISKKLATYCRNNTHLTHLSSKVPGLNLILGL